MTDLRSGWNVMIDVILATLPITIFYKLQMSLKQRCLLSSLLGLGLLAAICGSIKMKYLAGLNARSDLTCNTPLSVQCSSSNAINRGNLLSFHLVRIGALCHHSMRVYPTHQTRVRFGVWERKTSRIYTISRYCRQWL